MDPNAWWSLLDKGGLIAGLLILLTLLLAGKLHTDREFQALVKDRDEWRSQALRGTQLAGRSTDLAHDRRGLVSDVEAILDERLKVIFADERSKPRSKPRRTVK